MSTLYLHVGHGKTGSSFIQSSLALSQDVLLEHGVDYPESNSAARAKQGRITSGNGALLRSVVEKKIVTKTDKVLLSSEVLFHDMVEGKLDDVLRKLDAAGYTSVKILLFTRDLVEHAASSYQQMIKRGGSTVSIETMFSRYKQPELVANFIDRCHAQPNISVKICNYSNCKKSILQEVETWLSLPHETLMTPEIEKVNRSMTRSELRLQKGVNSVLGQSGRLVSDPLCDRLPDINSEMSLPDEDAQQAMLNRLKRVSDHVNKYASSEHQYNHFIIPVDENSLREDNYIFTGKQIDTIAKGLAGEIKNLRSLESMPPKPEWSVQDLDFKVFSKKLQEKFGRHSADTLRDIAMCLEQSGDLESAYYFMGLALKARPTGKVIEKKVAEYRDRLQKS